MSAYLLVIANRELDPQLNSKGSASDLVQETFLEAQRDFAGFHGSSEAEWRGWLRQMLVHNLANFVRRYRDTDKRKWRTNRARRRWLAKPVGRRAAGVRYPFAKHGSNVRGSAQVVAAAIARLPDDYSQVIALRYKEGRSFEQIGRSCSAPTTPYASCGSAIERLEQELKKCP